MEAGTSPGKESQATRPAPTGTDEAIAGAVVAQHCIMFWVLTVLAMVVFAPCVLAPIYAETEQIMEAERKLERLVTDLADQEKRIKGRIEALKADPLVNQRVVRREFNYRPEGEQIIQWSSAELAAIRLDLSELESTHEALPPVNPYPDWVLKVGQWLPAWPWRKLFVESPNRELLAIMAAGLLATAFLLYGPIPVISRERRPTR